MDAMHGVRRERVEHLADECLHFSFGDFPQFLMSELRDEVVLQRQLCIGAGLKPYTSEVPPASTIDNRT
jgi:hypothetical protein